MLVALTGATGFIGSRLCARLCEAGHGVRALSRSARVPGSAETVRGDLADGEALARLVQGADAVLHLAASVRGANARDFDEPNVRGTTHLLDALDTHAAQAPLLLLSSLAAREPTLSWYASSKRQAEELVRARCHARPFLILRPPAVYGAGDREMLPVFRFMARTGLAPCAAPARQRMSLLHVDDLVEAIIAWLGKRGGCAEPVSIHDGRPRGYDWSEIAAIAAHACGRRIRVWYIPRAPLDFVAALNLRMARLTGRAPMLTPGKLRELRHVDWAVEDAPLPELPGWQPAIDLAEGLRRTPGWH